SHAAGAGIADRPEGGPARAPVREGPLMGVATIVFTDDDDTGTIRNGMPSSWIQHWMVHEHADDEDARFGWGTGTRHRWLHRADYGASFELAHIPAAYQALVGRLLRHLRGGGSCTVNTGDAASRSYTCTIWPGWDTEAAKLTNREAVEYTLRLQLRNSVAA